MGKKSTPQAPTPPDPVATAAAQGAQNRESAIAQANLNRIDQYTPQGSITYSQIGTNADGTPQYAQTQKYSDSQQALYDQQNQVAQGLGSLATDNINRVAQAQATPFSFDGMQPLSTINGNSQLQGSGGVPQLNTNIGATPAVQGGYNSGGGIQSTFGQSGPLTSNVASQPFGSQIAGAGDVTRDAGTANYQSSIAGAGDLTRGAQGGSVQQSLNYGGGFNPGEFNQTAQAAANAMYGQATSRLDPQYQQQESDMRARLANSGISENSDAFRREMDNFARSKTDAYNQANYSSIGAGLAAQQQGYGQALNTRQQNTNEITNAGQFANAAQAQQFGQSATNASINNAAQGQQFNQNAAQAALYNQAQQAGYDQRFNNAQLNNAAQGQVFGQNAQQLDAYNNFQNNNFQQGMANANLNNTAQGQQYQQNLGAAQFGNQAQQQQNQQNMQQAAFGNAAQDQYFQQQLAQAGFGNDAASQQFGMNQSAAAFNNQAAGQAFNQQSAAAGFNNQVRQQQIDEASYLRNLPLNDIAALLGTGGGVQNPQFQDFAQVGVAAPDYQGAVYANYNAANQQYQSAMQARSQGLGSIFGALGSLGGAAIMSDRRLKHGITRVGALANGLATYWFSYLGSKVRHFGVMAQEVMNVVPDAVIVTPSGYMAVDYRKVW